MGPSYKPNGYNTVSPYLVVDGASDTIDFLRRVFGAVKLRRFPDAAGKLLHAEVRIDDTVVMIADGVESWRCPGRSSACSPAPPFSQAD